MKTIQIVTEFREVHGTNNYSDHFSIKSIDAILKSIRSSGYECQLFGGVDDLIAAVNKNCKFNNEYFLNLSDGRTEHSRKAQAPVLLEMLGAYYSGSDAEQHLIMMDKQLSKDIAADMGIAVPKGLLINKGSRINNLPNDIKGPYVVKPNNQGSSVGIDANCLCDSLTQAVTVANGIANKYNLAVIESYIPGIELTVFLLGNDNSFDLCEIVVYGYNGQSFLERTIFTLELKKNRQREYHKAHEIFDKEVIQNIKSCAQLLFTGFRCRDIARIDFRIAEDGKLYFLEINGLPMISETSELGIIASWKRKSFSDLIGMFVKVFLNRIESGH